MSRISQNSCPLVGRQNTVLILYQRSNPRPNVKLWFDEKVPGYETFGFHGSRRIRLLVAALKHRLVWFDPPKLSGSDESVERFLPFGFLPDGVGNRKDCALSTTCFNDLGKI